MILIFCHAISECLFICVWLSLYKVKVYNFLYFPSLHLGMNRLLSPACWDHWQDTIGLTSQTAKHPLSTPSLTTRMSPSPTGGPDSQVNNHVFHFSSMILQHTPVRTGNRQVDSFHFSFFICLLFDKGVYPEHLYMFGVVLLESVFFLTFCVFWFHFSFWSHSVVLIQLPRAGA